LHQPEEGEGTPLHLAATHAQIRLLKYLLTYFSGPWSESEDQGLSTLDAILVSTGEDGTVLDCAALGHTREHRLTEQFIWDEQNLN
jgi:hypothetical protein